MKPGQLITVKQAADLLSVHPQTIMRWVRNRTLPSARIGGSIRIDQNRVEQLVNTQMDEVGGLAAER